MIEFADPAAKASTAGAEMLLEPAVLVDLISAFVPKVPRVDAGGLILYSIKPELL